jgi:PAS domain S-box-containing protein
LLGEDFSQVLRLLWQEPYASEVEQRFRNTLATGESYRVEQSLERRNAGQRERLDWRIERIELPDGEFGVVCYYYDLSERHRLEAELRVRERELQSLADNSPDIMVRFDTQLRHVFVNRALEKMTGRPPEHFLGKTCEESLLDPELCELWSSGLSRVLTHGRAEQLEFSLAGPQGQRSYASTLLPELDSGRQVASILAVTHDITDQKRVEQVLQESDRRKDEFLATLAHELRNPLAPLRTGMSVIQDVNAAPALVARAYSIMERQLGHMVRLVDDLLDLSRISRGKIELQRSRVTVQSVIEQAIEISQPLIDAGKHSLIVEVPEKDLWIDGDVTRLAQVVSNLLNNAAKYTPEAGQIGLRVALIGDIIEVHVTDSGTGISPDILPFVFDLFTQSENTRARAQGGLGIGLSLVKRLVEMHGGSVSAYSAGLGRGSSFCVCLAAVAAPAASATASGVSAVATGHSQERPAPAPLRVLVVDDNEDAAEMLATTLKLRGYATSVAFSGPAALDSARSFHPDVVLLDIGLPDMDGHEVARAFRRDEQLRSATLVALTGWGSEQDKAKSRDAGFDFHLVKPADIRSIQEILARAQP